MWIPSTENTFNSAWIIYDNSVKIFLLILKLSPLWTDEDNLLLFTADLNIVHVHYCMKGDEISFKYN